MRKVYEETVNSLEWLVGALDLPGSKESIVESIAPKIATFLLPVNKLCGYRQKFQIMTLPTGLHRLVWQTFLGILGAILSKREWPKTMEINCKSAGNVSHLSRAANHGNSICIVSSMQGYGKICVHLANSLVENGYSVDLLVPEGSGKWQCLSGLSEGVRVSVLENFFSRDMEKRFRSHCRLARNRWPEITARICHNGPEVLQDLFRIAPRQLEYVVTNVIPQAYVYRDLGKFAVEMLQPKTLFVVRLKRITENVFVDAAKRLGIPVILANHGHIGVKWDPLSLGNVEKRCDAILSWNAEQKKTWLTLFPEMEPKKIYAVGGIQWDEPIKRYIGINGIRKRQIREKIVEALKHNNRNQIEIDQKWLTVTIDDHVKRVLKKVLKGLNSLKGFHLFIKTRPHESAGDYSRIMKIKPRFPMTIVSKDSDVDLFDLLYASDLVMTCVSTTNLDTLSVGTPLLTLSLDRKARSLDRYVCLDRYGLPVISSGMGLSKMVGRWITDGRHQMVYREAAINAAHSLLANYPRGDAGEKIAELIDTLSHSTIKKKVPVQPLRHEVAKKE